MNKTILATALLTALNFQVIEADPELADSQESYAPPEWIPMCPEGVFSGRDGRTFNNKSSQAVIDWIVANEKDIQIDINHASELKAPRGEDAPAYGWIRAQASEFKVEDNQIFARPEWNYSGKWRLEDKQYRYYSPVFIVNPNKNEETNALDIIGITSVGLTNDPNLFVPALNSQVKPTTKTTNQKDIPMDISKLRAVLGLEASTTLDDDKNIAECITAINSMKTNHETALNTANNKQPDMTKFIPRGDYNAAINRAETAEDALKQRDAKDLEGKIETALNAALDSGKITPATRDYYKGQCEKDGGLDEFIKFAELTPAVVGGETNLNSKTPGGDTATALNSDQKYAADQLNISHEDYAEALKKENS